MNRIKGLEILTEYKEIAVKGQCYELAAHLRGIERKFILVEDSNYEGFNTDRFISALCECYKYHGSLPIVRDLKIRNLLNEL